MQGRALSRLAADLNLSPGDAVLDASAEGLGASLFGGKPRSKAFSGATPLPLTVGDLLRGEDPRKETAAKAIDGCGDTVNFDHIDSGTDKHECNLNDFAQLGNSASRWHGIERKIFRCTLASSDVLSSSPQITEFRRDCLSRRSAGRRP